MKDYGLYEYGIPERKLKKLPKWIQFLMERFPAKKKDIIGFFRYAYGIPQLERMKGAVIQYGKGEENLAIIKRVTNAGVWVQPFELEDEIDKGIKKKGKEMFIKRERFEKHLGEKGAVSPEIFLEF